MDVFWFGALILKKKTFIDESKKFNHDRYEKKNLHRSVARLVSRAGLTFFFVQF